MIFKTDYEFCIDHPQILLWFSVQDSKVEYVSTFVFGDKSETGVFSLLFCSGFPLSLSILFVKGSVYSYMMFYLHS